VFRLGELADRLGLAFSGEADTPITGLASLSGAGPGDLTFLADQRQRHCLADTTAAAVILRAEDAPVCPTAWLETDDPYLAMARASALFAAVEPPPAGIHPTAVIADDARVAHSASVGPHVVVGAGAVVGERAVLDAGVHVGAGSMIGEGTHLYPQVVIYPGVHIGKACVIHSHAVLGADGFGFASSPAGWVKQHQFGGVRIGDQVEIGACTTIDRGTFDDTVIGDGVIIDNQVQIGHNCVIGERTAIAGCVGLAGSTRVGARCTLAGGVGVVGHLEICDDVHVTGMSMVTRSIDRPGSYSSGTSLSDTPQWRRNAVRFSRLDQMHRRLAALEKAAGRGPADDAAP
jgi:UDP-3-O-[3-hydroxymyristoyl] glucosamine N-acyltransferase